MTCVTPSPLSITVPVNVRSPTCLEVQDAAKARTALDKKKQDRQKRNKDRELKLHIFYWNILFNFKCSMPGKKIYKINLHYAIELFTSYILLRQTYKFIFAFRDIFINFSYFSESLFSPKAKKMWKTNMKLYSIRLSRLKLCLYGIACYKQQSKRSAPPTTQSPELFNTRITLIRLSPNFLSAICI